jgi:hypothetical protein
MWRGDLDPAEFVETEDRDDSYSHDDLDKQISKTFPGNLFCVDTLTDDEKIRYASIEGFGAAEITIDNGMKIPLPPLDGIPLTFVVSTNAKTIRLTLASEAILEITEGNLDDDLTINTKTLSQPLQFAWEIFLKDNVRPSVKIKFLFSR